MQCQIAQELFSDYLTGQMDRALEVSLQNHLDACTDCRESVAELRRVWTALDNLPVTEPPAFFHENLMSRIAAEEAQAEEIAARQRAIWDWRSLFRPKSLAFAGLAVLALLASVEVVQTQRAALGPFDWIFQIFRPAPAPKPLALEKQEVSWTPDLQGEGGTLTVTLKIVANAETSPLHYTLTLDGVSGALGKGSFPPGGTLTVQTYLPKQPVGDALHFNLTTQSGAAKSWKLASPEASATPTPAQ